VFEQEEVFRERAVLRLHVSATPCLFLRRVSRENPEAPRNQWSFLHVRAGTADVRSLREDTCASTGVRENSPCCQFRVQLAGRPRVPRAQTCFSGGMISSFRRRVFPTPPSFFAKKRRGFRPSGEEDGDSVLWARKRARAGRQWCDPEPSVGQRSWCVEAE